MHDRSEIVGPQRVHCAEGYLARRGLLYRLDRLVEQDDDQTAFARHVAGRHVRRNLVQPRRRRWPARHARGQVDGGKCGERYRLPIDADREVGGRQTGDRIAIAIEDRHVDLNDVDAGAERGLGRGELLRGEDSRDPDDPHSDNDRRSWKSHVHLTYPALASIVWLKTQGSRLRAQEQELLLETACFELSSA